MAASIADGTTELVQSSKGWIIKTAFERGEEFGNLLNPRYYAERLAFRTWEEVSRHIQSSKWPPRWWADEDQRRAAQRKFLSLVAQAQGKPAV
jgi:hypothetical protein